MKTNNKKLHTMVNNFQTNITSQLNDQWSQFGIYDRIIKY